VPTRKDRGGRDQERWDPTVDHQINELRVISVYSLQIQRSAQFLGSHQLHIDG